jgi:cell division protein FtsQ
VTIDRPRRGTPAAIAVIGLLALGLGGWVVLNSAFFALREIRVEGARTVPVQEIRDLAALHPGDNLVMLPVEEVARRVETHPWVLDARVERDLPTTALITVIERRPGGWVRDPGGIAVLAGDGTVLERLQARPPTLPEIGELIDTPTVGERVTASIETLRVAAAMGEALRRQVESLTLEGEQVVGVLRGGGTVLFGPPEELGAKNRALAEMLRWARQEAIVVRTIDVRVPSAPSLEPLRPHRDLTPIPSP